MAPGVQTLPDNITFISRSGCGVDFVPTFQFVAQLLGHVLHPGFCINTSTSPFCRDGDEPPAAVGQADFNLSWKAAFYNESILRWASTNQEKHLLIKLSYTWESFGLSLKKVVARSQQNNQWQNKIEWENMSGITS